VQVVIGSDHAGFELKRMLLQHLGSQGHAALDVGTSSTEAVDYPIFARAVAEAVTKGQAERGIIVDGAGIGSAMVANKVPGVRAALAYDLSSARNSREHNDANILTLGAGLTGPALARNIVDAFLATDCTEERHLRRVGMIESVATSAGTGESPAGAGPTTIDDADLDRIVARLEALLGAKLSPGTPPGVAERPETARRFLEMGAGALSAGPAAAREIPRDIAHFIDHTLLRADATRDEVLELCAQAREHGFRSVCVNPTWVATVAGELAGSPVLACSVVGFPLGAATPEIKGMEARRAIRDGAKEIDMVLNVGALKSGDEATVLKDIRAVAEACRDGSAVCKVILETALLTDEEKRVACRLAKKARAHFVKTSTGFGPGGATAEDVALMAEEVRGAGMEVKASGGIRSFSDAKRMIEAGATRIGASASVAIVEEAAEAVTNS